jgi:hemerythrin-like domain-containing protein
MTRPADSRAMHVVHRVFRREFTNLPVLIRGVADGDTGRAAVVADHVDFLNVYLHDHHHAEDEHVWPKLKERVSADLGPLVQTMENQHHGLDRVLTDLVDQAANWRTTAAAGARDQLAATADTLITVLFEHLVLEEREILPLIDRHLAEEEWALVGKAALDGLPKPMLPVVAGMTLYEADPEARRIIKDEVPAVMWWVLSPVAPRAYRRYAKRVYGTPNPPRYAPAA